MDLSSNKDKTATDATNANVSQQPPATQAQLKCIFAPNMTQQERFNTKFCFLQGKTIEELRQLSSSGDLDARAELGYRLYTGQGVMADPVEGMEILEQTAKSSNILAAMNLITVCIDYNLPKESLLKAHSFLASFIFGKKKKNKPLVQANFLMGKLCEIKDLDLGSPDYFYYEARGSHITHVDYWLSRGRAICDSAEDGDIFYDLREVAKQGYIPAITSLAHFMYIRECFDSVENDFYNDILSRNLFRRHWWLWYPRFKGHDDFLEFFESYDYTKVRLSSKTIHWLEKAAECGDDKSALYLGKYLRFNPKEGDCLEFLWQAAASDDLIIEFRAILEIILLYKEGNATYPKDLAKASELALEMYDDCHYEFYEEGHAEALIFIGRLYSLGLGCPKSIALATEAYLLAGDKGQAIAYIEAGKLHLEQKQMPALKAAEAFFYKVQNICDSDVLDFWREYAHSEMCYLETGQYYREPKPRFHHQDRFYRFNDFDDDEDFDDDYDDEEFL